MNRKPACANWSVWEGVEVEGLADLGVSTLFVRHLPSGEKQARSFLRAQKTRYSRIWFCAEFRDWSMVKYAFKLFPSVCVEINYGHEQSVPSTIRQRARLYLKVRDWVGLKAGDYVCFGSAYADEAFELGAGKLVSPKDYSSDTRLL
jgi:hypothetical protein